MLHFSEMIVRLRAFMMWGEEPEFLHEERDRFPSELGEVGRL